MKTYTMNCVDPSDIEAFVNTNNLVNEKNILVQAFSGVLDETYIVNIQKQLAKSLPQAILIGTTTDGEIKDGEIFAKTITLSFTVFSSTILTPTILPFEDTENSFIMGEQLIINTYNADTKAIIIFAGGFNIDLEEMFKGVNSVQHKAVVSGGLAADNGDFNNTFVFDNHRILKDGVVAVGLCNKNLIVNTLSNSDWKKTGRPFMITKATGNRLYELDYKPPISIMKKYLGQEFTMQLPQSGAEFPFMVERKGKDVSLFVTNVFDDGSIELSGKVSENEKLFFSFANVPVIIDNSIKEMKRLSKKPIESIFIYDCMARKRYFHSFVKKEIQVLQQIAQTSGFFSYGEFSKVDDESKLVAYSLTLLALSESTDLPNNPTIEIDYTVPNETQSLIALSNLIYASSKDIDLLYQNYEESEQRYKSLFEHNTDIVYSTDLQGRFTSVNGAFSKVFGYKEEELLYKNSLKYINENDIPRVRMHFNRVLKGKEQYYNLEIPTKYGDTLLFQIKNIPIVINGKKVGIYGIGRDITEQKKAEEKIAYLAFYDTETGLPNRLKFKEQLEDYIVWAKRKKKKLAILFIDLDRFKIINDSLGHYQGDLILKQVIERVKKVLPSRSYLGRFEGDKFTLVLSKNVDIDHVIDIGQKILQEIGKPILYEEQEFFITASIGVSMYPNDDKHEDYLLKHADTAMNLAKHHGGNKLKFYSTEMNTEALYRLELESYLRKALEKNEFHLCYQPLISLATGKIYGSEALIRWNHPKLGLVSPGDFIPLAEETGLIQDIGKWVMLTACKQNKKWHEMGYKDLTISVNVSANQFQQMGFVAEVKEAIAQSGLDPRYLNIELTESVMLRNISYSIMAMKDLQNMGVKVSIDDFGTGYSSLSYLKNLPFNTLKIDRSFINNIHSSNSEIAIVKAIITMGHGLAVKVVAEGVETEEQIKLLKELECHYAQGFFINKPLSSKDFEKGLVNQG
ncbi:EAL domain-containing protein [Bacillus luteolus]|uniref:EAL domain-containing protein n=1 Tax=Litchfieldia luteola TaxID=682179 RepID=A0ABR9QLD8_9BACI|nr:EAL domain-containing protein [Cytobacillus luteolus]MBE4909305.1 EAL domain-containing protein [Cytobacillus luteolus]MBP1940699.1 diguanylate cyclase (GGDEF)-like protein/PAS domain S-box-containing protein [Cytobacillus luteolus]